MQFWGGPLSCSTIPAVGGRRLRVGTALRGEIIGVQVYVDDILIISKTKEEHLIHVRMILETLKRHRLYAKASKCQFGRTSVAILGHVISEQGVADFGARRGYGLS